MPLPEKEKVKKKFLKKKLKLLFILTRTDCERKRLGVRTLPGPAMSESEFDKSGGQRIVITLRGERLAASNSQNHN
jgi:hypothetical protein